MLVAKNGVAIGHVGRLLGIPSVSFEDAEHATLQILLSRPFVKHIYTERCFLGAAGRKHRRYDSLNALAYLHPHRFQPEGSILDALGIAHDEPFAVVRFVSWDAAHDLGQRRNRDGERRELVQGLAERMRVVIVPESTLSADLMRWVPPLPAHRFHDLLALATLHVGEGGSTAAEAGVLGVPNLYLNPLKVGYVCELQEFGLCRWETDYAKALAIAREWFDDLEEVRRMHRSARERLLAAKGDPVPMLVREDPVLHGLDARAEEAT